MIPNRQFTICVGAKTIGHSALEHQDPSMGIAFGEFFPAQEYQTFASIFELFAKGHYEKYYSQRDELNLKLKLVWYGEIQTDYVHIVDYTSEIGPCELQVEIKLQDSSVFERHFSNAGPA